MIILRGGPCEGERHVVRDGQHDLRFRERKPLTFAAHGASPTVEQIAFKTLLYQQGSDNNVFEYEGEE